MSDPRIWNVEQRVPFWSSKTPTVETVLGESTYHLSGFHSQRVSGDEIIMDDFSLLGQWLRGADLGPIVMTLSEPFRASLAADGAFHGKASMLMMSGPESSTLGVEISGKLGEGAGGFDSLCIVAEAEYSVIRMAGGSIAGSVRLTAA